MTATPNTVGLILLFIAVFLACILWATRGMFVPHEVDHEHKGNPGVAPPSKVS